MKDTRKSFERLVIEGMVGQFSFCEDSDFLSQFIRHQALILELHMHQ